MKKREMMEIKLHVVAKDNCRNRDQFSSTLFYINIRRIRDNFPLFGIY